MRMWFALYTKPHKEDQVRAVLDGKGWETFLPSIPVARPRAGRRKEHPFFPCYLFVRADQTSGEVANVRWTPGLRRIVSYGDAPVPVPDELVDLIKERLAEKRQLMARPPGARFEPGQRVSVTDGPLKSMEAIFERSVSAGERVRVLIDVLGRLTSCELDGSWIVEG